MSRKPLEAPPLSDRSQLRRISQKSVDELNQTLHARINSMVGLDEQLNTKIKQLQSNTFTTKDLTSIGLSLQDMVTTLQKVSFNEIMYNQLLRENEKLKSEQSYLKAQLFKFNQLNSKFQKEHQLLLEKIRSQEADINNLNKKLIAEQKLNEELSKKLKRSEQRVQIILESNITLQKDQIKHNLIEVLSENEQIKKDAIQKQKDFQKLQMVNNSLNQKIYRLNNRFQIRSKIQNEEDFIDQEKMVITFTEIPQNFVFRHVFQNLECKQFIQQVLEFSAEDFILHMNQLNPENKKMQLTWLFNHMINYKEFSLAHNVFIIKLSKLMQIYSYDEMHNFFTTLSSFFKVSHVYLWLRDFQTGFFINQIDGKQKKIICAKGVFRDSLETRESVNKLTAHKHIIYQNETGEDVYQDSTYIFPIITDAALPAGLIEFHHPIQSNNFSDIQYFASIVGLYTKIQIQKIDEQTQKISLLKQTDLLQSQFLKLIRAKDKFHFRELMKEMQCKIMQLSTSEIVFVENNGLWKYYNEEIKKLDSLAGVCGQVAISMQPAYFANISKELNFNQIVDMYSIAPIFIYPIVHNNKTFALIQVSLTNKQIDKYRFKDPLVSLSCQSNQARLFCDYVSTAYIHNNILQIKQQLMQRTDILMNRINILIVFLAICLFLALFGRKSTEDQKISEHFEPEVTESEIQYYLENDINYKDSDQFGIQTIQDWLPIQSELAQLNLALEYFSRLNLEQILNKQPQLEEQVQQCQDLNLNLELEIFLNQTNQSQISPINYDLLFDKKKKLNEGIFHKKAEYDSFLIEENELKLICAQYQISESETKKLKMKQAQFDKIIGEIKELEQSINDLKLQLQSYLQEKGDQEDLTKEYQKDQELAKNMSKLFKPAGTKWVEIRNHWLGGILNVLDRNMKQYTRTEVFLNGLNFHPEMQQYYIEEIKQTIQRNQTILEYRIKEKLNLETEIGSIENKRTEKNQSYKNALNRLEQIRRKKSELLSQMQQEKKELNEINQILKNYNPQKNFQNNDQQDAQKKLREFLYQNLKEDQLCVEKCIQYNSLNQQISSRRNQVSLDSIQKHFKQLEQKFKEFNQNQ
ncbi:unnamed protein product [Paramecium sonneborni]|uniref:GAF domain-containing protein n=1 Tax=Paramecium sonneborni TaxID=65129 RepID=A0A8S1LTB9_9CILI|nr:unnamed protein product [Paramecium sonneborni]